MDLGPTEPQSLYRQIPFITKLITTARACGAADQLHLSVDRTRKSGRRIARTKVCTRRGLQDPERTVPLPATEPLAAVGFPSTRRRRRSTRVKRRGTATRRRSATRGGPCRTVLTGVVGSRTGTATRNSAAATAGQSHPDMLRGFPDPVARSITGRWRWRRRWWRRKAAGRVQRLAFRISGRNSDGRTAGALRTSAVILDEMPGPESVVICAARSAATVG